MRYTARRREARQGDDQSDQNIGQKARKRRAKVGKLQWINTRFSLGKAEPSRWCSGTPKPVTSARRAPDNADFIVIQTHLSFGFWSDAKQSSASRRYGCRWWPQFRDQPQDVGKQISRDGDLGHLECGRRSKSSLRNRANRFTRWARHDRSLSA
jgi:hypothetical protein